MDAIFMNSKNNKTYDTHRLLLFLSDKIDFKKRDKYVSLLNLIKNIYTYIYIYVYIKVTQKH